MNTCYARRSAGLSSCYHNQKHKIGPGRSGRFTGLVIFVLLGLLLASCLLVLTAGSRVWNDLKVQTDHNFTVRTVLSYVANKVRAAESVDILADDNGVLVLSSNYNGTEYNTYIYYRDGALLEYFGRADLNFRPELGQSIAECNGFSVCRAGGVIYVTVTDAGGQTSGMHLAAGGGTS